MKKSKYVRQNETHTENEYMWNRYDFAEFWLYWRLPRTFNEYRQNSHAVEDGYYVRPKRCKRGWGGIPSAWDDIPVSNRWGKSWKKFTRRKHQYYPAER